MQIVQIFDEVGEGDHKIWRKNQLIRKIAFKAMLKSGSLIMKLSETFSKLSKLKIENDNWVVF